MAWPATVEVQASAGSLVTDPPVTIGTETPAVGNKTEQLSYSAPDDRWTRRTAVARSGGLDRLRGIAAALAKRYRRQESQATVFVLTGSVPEVSSIRSTVSLRAPYLATSRITMTVDPVVSEQAVADAYRKARRQLFGGRNRAISQKHLELAVFIEGRSDTEAWAARTQAWNAERPDWRYSEVRNFQRDARSVQRRLLNPAYDLQELEQE